jgi:glyoxylase-like metal-dependent hydrolase (beta-lactamase superfamily II)
MTHIESFFDPDTFTLTYVVSDPDSKEAVIIDPVLDFDPRGSQTKTDSIERVEAFVKSAGLRVRYVLETHAHADHLSASQYLKRRLDAKVAIGARITEVQSTFKGVFDLPETFRTDGSQFDMLLGDGAVLDVGPLRIEAIATPGHTPACLSYRAGDAVFTGDALFIEDYGTGRCDFPRGSAEELYASVHERLYALPDATRVFVGHDYQPGGRPLRYETTIGASKAKNIQLSAETTRDEFVAFRTKRDATLAAPRLLFPSVQVNIDAGRLPAPHANGLRYLRVPLNMKTPTGDDGAPGER